MNVKDLAMLRRAIQGQGTSSPSTLVVVAQRTTRDMHPTEGSHSILQAANAGQGRPRTVSINTTRADGSLGKAFSWGIPGFGWGDGEFPGG